MKKYLILLLFCLIPSLVYPATYYVDKDAIGGAPSDSNNCTALTTPCLTINGALGKITGSQANTINIRSDGDTEYSEYINPTSTKNGVAGGFLAIQGYLSEDPTIVGAYHFSGNWTVNTSPRYVTDASSITYTPKMYVVTCSGVDTLMDNRTATSAATVDTNGEWWYDATNDRAYARMPGGVNPSTCTNHRFAQYPTDPDTWNALFYVQADYILIQNLNIKYSHAGAIVGGTTAGNQGQFLQVKNVDVNWTYQAGIKAPNRDYTYFYNNTVNHAVTYKYLDTTSSLGAAPEPMSMQKGDYNVADSNTILNPYFMGCPSIGEGADSTLDTPNDSISINNTCTNTDHTTYTNRGWRNRFQNNIATDIEVASENMYLSPEPSKVANNKYNVYLGNKLKGGKSCARLLTYGASPNKIYNNYMVNNTCYDQSKGIYSQNTSTTIYDNQFINNIIFMHSGNPAIAVQNANPSDNLYKDNLHFSDASNIKYYSQDGSKFCSYVETGCTNSGTQQGAFTAWKSDMAPTAQDDTWGDPLWVDTTDFVLQTGSPAIDAGTPVATVQAQAGTCTAGSSTTIKVDNADFFHGPWGDDGTGTSTPIIAGDSIRIKGTVTDTTKVVSSVSYAANEAASRVGTIAVTAAFECDAGDEIHFLDHWSGTGVDIGAEEYISGAATCSAPTLNPVTTPTNDASQVISGNKTTNCSVLLNGELIDPLDTDTTWSYTMALQTGSNPISLTSKNSQGAESSATTGNIVRNEPPAECRNRSQT